MSFYAACERIPGASQTPRNPLVYVQKCQIPHIPACSTTPERPVDNNKLTDCPSHTLVSICIVIVVNYAECTYFVRCERGTYRNTSSTSMGNASVLTPRAAALSADHTHSLASTYINNGEKGICCARALARARALFILYNAEIRPISCIAASPTNPASAARRAQKTLPQAQDVLLLQYSYFVSIAHCMDRFLSANRVKFHTVGPETGDRCVKFHTWRVKFHTCTPYISHCEISHISRVQALSRRTYTNLRWRRVKFHTQRVKFHTHARPDTHLGEKRADDVWVCEISHATCEISHLTVHTVCSFYCDAGIPGGGFSLDPAGRPCVASCQLWAVRVGYPAECCSSGLEPWTPCFCTPSVNH